jgi:putative membrane protein
MKLYFWWSIRRVLIWLAALAVYSVALYLILPGQFTPLFSWRDEATAALSIIIGVLVAFHNRASHDRWWEGRKLWGQLVNDSRNLALKARRLVALDGPEAGEFTRLLSGFAHALRLHLRTGVRLQNVPGFETEPDQPQHVPSWLAGMLFERLAEWRQQSRIDGFTFLSLDQHARALMDVCGACERIRNTPLPPSQTALLRVYLVIYFALTPILMVRTLGPLGIIVFLFGAYLLLAFEFSCRAMEEPFGTDPDDLDLDRYCKTIEESARNILTPG